jgi:hypothetical protein
MIPIVFSPYNITPTLLVGPGQRPSMIEIASHVRDIFHVHPALMRKSLLVALIH